MRFIALWLAAACIVIFIAELFIGTDLLIMDRAVVLSEPWRVITAVFTHATLLHLLSNLFALGLFGLILEGRIGPTRVLWLFLGSGILVNIFTPYPRSLGASGAIYSLIGALAILRPLMVVWVDWMPMPMVVAGVVYLIQDTVGVFIPSEVGNLAHIGGLFVGIIAGMYWRKHYGDKVHWKRKPLYPSLEREIDAWEREYMGDSWDHESPSR